MSLKGKICLVTGASRGIGKGIALQLGQAGATVYITGRSLTKSTSGVGGTLSETASEIDSRGGKGIPVSCDHSDDEDVKKLFDRIKQEQGRLDVLVNNAYAAVHAILEHTKEKLKFWETKQEPGQFWDVVNGVGLRNHYICSSYAASMMVGEKAGLIVNISSIGGVQYMMNVAYGVGKSAIDRMSADMAVELKPYNVACVTLYPGAVLTEEVNNVLNIGMEDELAKRTFDEGETIEFSGKAVVALATDANVMTKTGKICFAAELGEEYKFKDINGHQPPSFRQVQYLLRVFGHPWIAAVVPAIIKVPKFLLALGASKF